MANVGLMANRVCLVTGATAGIGLVTARELARQGATVVIVSRNAEKCTASAETIRQETGNSKVGWLQADLSVQADVRRLANEFKERYQHLHVLVNNAGAMYELRRESADGIEMTFALNHLGPFLLTNLLLDTLKASAPVRIINVSSSAHKDVRAFDLADPEFKAATKGHGDYPRTKGRSLFYTLAKPWAHPAFLQYGHTKLANLLFTYELARRLAGSGVTVNALHPGFVATSFGATSEGPYTWCLRRAIRWFGIKPEEGAKTPIYLATSPEVETVSGKYFVKEKPIESSPASHDLEVAKGLWELSERMTGLMQV